MLKKAVVVAGAAAGLMALAPMANADSADNDGVNALDGNNISAVPVQLCNNNVAVIGVVANVLSPQVSHCTNAPVVDHPSA